MREVMPEYDEGELIVVLKYGPYEYAGTVKHRSNRLKGILKLLSAVKIPFILKEINFWDRFCAEIQGQTVFTCRLTNMEFDGDGTDFNSVIAFEAIRDAFKAAKRYYLRKNEDKITYQQNTGEKCFPITFDSFYLESRSKYKRPSSVTKREEVVEEEESWFDEKEQQWDEEQLWGEEQQWDNDDQFLWDVEEPGLDEEEEQENVEDDLLDQLSEDYQEEEDGYDEVENKKGKELVAEEESAEGEEEVDDEEEAEDEE